MKGGEKIMRVFEAGLQQEKKTPSEIQMTRHDSRERLNAIVNVKGRGENLANFFVHYVL